MESERKKKTISDIAEINPCEKLPKGTIAKKVPMDALQPFTRDIPSFEINEYKGGAKFRNGDTIMARITPCLENGKTAQVRILNEDEVAFGSTEYIVFRAKENTDADFLYYLICSPTVREAAIKSMVGSSGRQRVQKDVIANLELSIPSYEEQKKIGQLLKILDDKIQLNNSINKNLEQQARALFHQWIASTSSTIYRLSDIADINPETYSPKDNWRFVNYLDTSSIIAGTITGVQYILPSKEKLPSRARRILRKNDIVFSTVRPNQLHYGIISNPKPNMLGSTGFAVIRSKYTVIPNELIYLALTEEFFVEQMQHLAEQSVSTFPSIRPADLDACVLPEPKVKDDNFMMTIKTIFNTIATNDEESHRLAALRNTLLPRLISGELDISGIEI